MQTQSLATTLLPSNLKYKLHLSRQQNFWSFRCSWSIAYRRCSNFIFILNLTPDFNGLGKDNCQTKQDLRFGIWRMLYQRFYGSYHNRFSAGCMHTVDMGWVSIISVGVLTHKKCVIFSTCDFIFQCCLLQMHWFFMKQVEGNTFLVGTVSTDDLVL